MHAHVQRLVSVFKMATMLEDCTTKEQYCVVCFLSAKGLCTKDIHKEMFYVYGGKYLLCKAIHSWVEKCGTRFADDKEVEAGAEVTETTVKSLLCCGL
jgi:hypothetical protein